MTMMRTSFIATCRLLQVRTFTSWFRGAREASPQPSVAPPPNSSDLATPHVAAVTNAMSSAALSDVQLVTPPPDICRLRDHADQLHERFHRSSTELRSPSTGNYSSSLAFDVVEADVALVGALASSRDSGEQREALFRADGVWKSFGLGSKGHHNSKAAELTEEEAIEYKETARLRAEQICQRLVSCAVQLRDHQQAALWEKRLRTVKLEGAGDAQWGSGGAAGFSPAIAAAAGHSPTSSHQNVRPSPPPASGGNVQRSSIPHAPSIGMLGSRFEDVDDDEDQEHVRGTTAKHRKNSNNSSSDASGASGADTPQPQQVPPRPRSAAAVVDDDGPLDASKFTGRPGEDDDLSPSDRAKQNIFRMMRSQQQQGAIRTRPQGRHLGMGIDNLRQDMMVEDHPMMRNLMGSKAPVGPRWT